jgi:coproporphyrinogen III oxidase-like Fe-S oxidoreductase
MPKAAYRNRFGAEVSEHFGDALESMYKRGLIVEDETHIRPTKEGFYLNNEIGLALVGG